MKKILRHLLLATLCFLCVVSFASCSGGINKDEAKTFINDFFDAISAGDYDKAETFLHPERPADLETFLLDIEQKDNIDFQSGIKVDRYTGFSSSFYDSTVDGSTYELTMTTTVGEKQAKFTVEIVKNDNGYGIYNLYINVQK